MPLLLLKAEMAEVKREYYYTGELKKEWFEIMVLKKVNIKNIIRMDNYMKFIILLMENQKANANIIMKMVN